MLDIFHTEKNEDINNGVFVTILFIFLQVFKLTTSGEAEMEPPDLSVSGVLQFIPEKNEELRDDTDTSEISVLG